MDRHVRVAAAGAGEAQRDQLLKAVACDVQGAWDQNRQLLIGLVEAMPGGQVRRQADACPADVCGKSVTHVAGIDVALLSTFGGKTPAP